MLPARSTSPYHGRQRSGNLERRRAAADRRRPAVAGPTGPPGHRRSIGCPCAPDAKPLRGFGGAGVLEIVDNFDGDTYRAVYTVRSAGAIYGAAAR
jgi:hypothetical protein